MKTHNSFFNEATISLIRNNLKTNKAAAKMAAVFIEETSYWMNLTYEELRGLVFTPELKRSWFVRSDGSCPSCGKSVPMYNWKYDPVEIPWKMQCPHCSELFPKNDFAAYYKSGLDKNNDFRHNLADRSLLINPDGSDFGIDDGNGWYDENGVRYMFIGAYLSHAHWIKLVVTGVLNLSFSYILTDNPEYAYRAGMILDSIARHFPDFNFYTQGIMYEQEYKSNGYVNYWVDSNREVRIFALAYDQIFDILKTDRIFENILGKPFDSFCHDVEERIFFDAFNNMKKIQTNPPETPITVVIIKSILNHNEQEITDYIDEIIIEATRVDGLSGESGLAGYAAITPRAIANLLCFYANIDISIIETILLKHPQLYKTYRFHIDTWYDASYYPGVGDSSVFALPKKEYTGLFTMNSPLSSIYHRSLEWFALKLSEVYNDPDFAKTIFLSHNKNISECFKKDYYMDNPKHYENIISDIIENYGEELAQKSINYNQWRISLLHTGYSDNKTMLAMPYDSGANHCHHDALSLHIFSKSINISPDFGYPPVNYGGWNTKEAHWYGHPAAHNQVVVDGKRHINLPPSGDGMFYRYPKYGTNLMFAIGSFVKATYNEAKEYVGSSRYERLIALIDISGSDCYCVDISRTEGGNQHSRFLRSSYSTTKTTGLNLVPGDDYYPEETIMRNNMVDKSPQKSWNIDFTIAGDDNQTPLKRNLHFKYTGISTATSVNTCESWVDITRMVQTSNIRTGNKSVWIPTIYETIEGPKTQFSGVHEVYEDHSNIVSINKLNIHIGNFDEAIKVIHIDGTCDYIIANDPLKNNSMKITEKEIKTDAILAIIRFKNSIFLKATVCSGSFLQIKDAYYVADINNSDIEFI